MIMIRHFTQKKSIYWVWVSAGPKPKPKSIWVWIINLILYILVQKSITFKIFDTHKFLGLKISDFLKIQMNSDSTKNIYALR